MATGTDTDLAVRDVEPGDAEDVVRILNPIIAARVYTVFDTPFSVDAERDYIRAHIMITVLPKQMPAVVQALHDMPEVRVLHSVSGAFDLVAMGVVPSVAEMDELTDRIGAIDGVERTTSSIILSAKFER